MIVNVENVSHGFGSRQILDHVSFKLNPLEHIGLVGANGEGKSTFINILTNNLIPDEGKITWSKHITSGYLDQYTKLTPGKTIREVLREAFNETVELEKEMLKMCDELANVDPDKMDEMLEEIGEIQSTLETSGFYEIDTKIEEVANGFGINGDYLERDVTELSGGQRSKVLLIKLLLQNPKILILDEPTNFLDEDHIRWLTRFLQNYEYAFILVSHDTKFLNDVCNIIYHLDNGVMTKYTGNYDFFVQQYDLKKRQTEQAYVRQQKEIEKMETFIAKNKARIATTTMARSRQKQLDKMEIIELVREKPKATFNFKEARTPGRVIVEGKDVVLGYDSPLTCPINFWVERNKKIAIKGINGIGKSTLLKTMFGYIPPFSGEITHDPFLEIGYFAQEEKASNKTALDEIWDLYPNMTNAEARAALASCGLTREHIESLMRVLSGGENARVRLCKIMLSSSNVLVLDEPTNHLDVNAKDSLKEALIRFKGTIVLVSHEPSFYDDWVDEVWDAEKWSNKI